MTLPGADEVQIRSRYLGTGNADTTTKYIFVTNQHRDTSASIISHSSSLCAYYAVAQNNSILRTKYNSLEAMIQPCGIPPHLQQQQQPGTNNSNNNNANNNNNTISNNNN
jgi:splicing factor 3B subunit 5